MKITARANVKSELIDDYCFIPNLVAGRDYEVIGMEYEYYRLVNDYLDPVLVHPIFCEVKNYQWVKDWISDIDDDSFCLLPMEFNKHPYFFEKLHDGNLEYVDIYMRYLNTLFPTSELIDKIYTIYINAVNQQNPIVSYWLKQWMKQLFGVDKAVELRRFSKEDWQKRLQIFFEH